MKKFTKGYTYVVYSARYKHYYLVRQVSMKGWVAVNFTNTDAEMNLVQFQGNGIKLWETLDVSTYQVCSENKQLRETMFNVLRYGHFTD